MSEMYYNIKNSDLFVPWPSVKDALETHGIVSNAPALAFLRGVLAEKPDFGRDVAVGSVEVNSGEFWEFTSENTLYSDFA